MTSKQATALSTLKAMGYQVRVTRHETDGVLGVVAPKKLYPGVLHLVITTEGNWKAAGTRYRPLSSRS